jgi:hypothetical protein
VAHSYRRTWCVRNEFGLSLYGYLISDFKHVNFKVIKKLVNKVPHCVHVSWVDLVAGLALKSHARGGSLAKNLETTCDKKNRV